MPYAEIDYLLLFQQADPTMHFGKISEGDGESTGKVARTPHVSEMRGDDAVVILWA
jgi:hypothetical protein